MAKPRKPMAMGAAECAGRTGLTVKALRVYERNGLITPARSPQGWRLYGPKELARLNTIVFLKGLGLTLAQIGEALTGATPSFEKVLQIQLDTLRARRNTADQAIGLVEAALGRIKTRKHLSIDDLCALVRSGEMGEVDAVEVQVISKELALEMFTAEERMRWYAYAATRSEERKFDLDHFAAARAIVAQLAKLMDEGVDPGSREPQRLLLRNHELAARHGVRQRFLEMADWEVALAQKIFAYGTCVMERAARLGKRAPDGIFAYMLEVRQASEWGRALNILAEEAKMLLAREELPGSSAAHDLARRLQEICELHHFGDTVQFCRFQATFGRIKRSNRWVINDAHTTAAWEYLALAATSWTQA